jgi:hypothetical protein
MHTTNFSLKSWGKTTIEVSELEGTGPAFTTTERPAQKALPRVEYDEASFESKDSLSRKPFRAWKPHTQRAPFLLVVVLASGGVIALLHIFLLRSNRDNGIIFAPDVTELPAGQAFCYLYLPTMISLLLSFMWTWIDLDVKRLQPFWQLSRKGGARGKDSILLHYPFDFVAFVPFKAMKKGYVPPSITDAKC